MVRTTPETFPGVLVKVGRAVGPEGCGDLVAVGVAVAAGADFGNRPETTRSKLKEHPLSKEKMKIVCKIAILRNEQDCFIFTSLKENNITGQSNDTT